MKKLVSLILVLAVFGIAVADVAPARRLVRPPVNLAQQSVDQPGLVGPWFRAMLRFFSPSYWPVEPKYSVPPQVVPIPPVCGSVCLRMPVQGIVE